MSKQMTREEAHTLLYNAIKSLWRHDSMHLPDYANDNLTMRTTALSILAPEPRTEPPGVEVESRLNICDEYDSNLVIEGVRVYVGSDKDEDWDKVMKALGMGEAKEGGEG